MAGGLLFEASAVVSVDSDAALDAVRAALEELATEILVDVSVVDVSPDTSFRRHTRAFPPAVRHVRPAQQQVSRGGNGKVQGVLTGITLARHERLVIADDDVRYSEEGLSRVLRLLDGADLVRPGGALV